VSRVQLALNVSDVDAAVVFYSKLFGAEPAKRRPGYANFAIAEPPLKLVLIEDVAARGTGVGGALNHLGVEVASTAAVGAAGGRLAEQGLATVAEDATTCCYAVQDKVWVSDPDGAPWEIYTVLADAPAESGLSGDGACCTPDGGCAPADVAVPVGVPAAATASSGCC
jgi:catechol 2,3-dioxygenase-like lactoylglutathione lyase family enzyme